MKKFKKTKFLAIILILFIIFCYWQNNDLTVSRFTYSELNGFKIAQVSDLHNKSFGKNNEKLLELLTEEDPDMIVITGDFVDSRRTDIDVALDFAEQIIKIAPVYFVNGNHEERLSKNEHNKLYDGLEDLGVVVLDNDYRYIETKDGQGFYLIGIDNKKLKRNTLKNLVKNLDENTLKILLAHRPQFIEKYSDAGIDIVFSGHAHGGQIRFPIVGGLLAPDQGFFPEYTNGEYKVDNTTMYVSRGLGNSIFPIRIFNRPDLLIVD